MVPLGYGEFEGLGCTGTRVGEGVLYRVGFGDRVFGLGVGVLGGVDDEGVARRLRAGVGTAELLGFEVSDRAGREGLGLDDGAEEVEGEGDETVARGEGLACTQHSPKYSTNDGSISTTCLE